MMMSKEVLAVVAAIILPTVHELELEDDADADLLDSIAESVNYAHDICQIVEESMEPDGKERSEGRAHRSRG